MWIFSIITGRDPNTPLEETMAALDLLVRQSKALYIGLSHHLAPQAERAFDLLRELGAPYLIHQPKYSMFELWVEPQLLSSLASHGVGAIALSTLAGGVLTDRYINGIPEDSRAASQSVFLSCAQLTEEKMAKVLLLNAAAAARGQNWHKWSWRGCCGAIGSCQRDDHRHDKPAQHVDERPINQFVHQLAGR